MPTTPLLGGWKKSAVLSKNYVILGGLFLSIFVHLTAGDAQAFLFWNSSTLFSSLMQYSDAWSYPEGSICHDINFTHLPCKMLDVSVCLGSTEVYYFQASTMVWCTRNSYFRRYWVWISPSNLISLHKKTFLSANNKAQGGGDAQVN